MGWSDGGALALGAAAHSDTVTAVAAHEPAVWSLMREDDLAGSGATVERWSEAAADGRLRDLPDVGHVAPLVAPEPVAREPITFLTSIREPA